MGAARSDCHGGEDDEWNEEDQDGQDREPVDRHAWTFQ
jgi:hypothetical protein